MRIALAADIHWSEFSSVIRTWTTGDKYSTRLKHCLDSVNWFEKLAKEWNCTEEIYLGDFFDKPVLNAAEISALKDIEWNDLPKSFLVGNHEADTRGLDQNSINAFALLKGFDIIDKPTLKIIEGVNFLFIPYYEEENLKTLEQYWREVQWDTTGPRIVLSHNSIKGISFGKVPSLVGVDLEDIKQNCNLFINGHLHNGLKICDNGFNLGNLTGQNFSEDASKYNHRACILDTETGEVTFVENPHAFNFYQIEVTTENTFQLLKELKNNAIVSFKCCSRLVAPLKEFLTNCNNVLQYRIVIIPEAIEETPTKEPVKISGDHLEKFITFCKENIENSEVLTFELNKVCEG